MDHSINCLRCKGVTNTHNMECKQSANGRYRVCGTCAECGANKSKFVNKQTGEGLISGLLGFKDGFPGLNRIPIIGQLL